MGDIEDEDYDPMNQDSEQDLNNRDMQNYRGYFVDEADEEEEEIKYYENGAHFPYDYLYQALEILLCEEPSQNNSVILPEFHKTEEVVDKPIHNHRSRNQHGHNNMHQQNKGMSVHPVHNLNINSQPKEIKEVMPHPVVVPSKTDQKNLSSLYSTFGSKMKTEKINFFTNTRNKEQKPVMMKTIQITNCIAKHKAFVNYNNGTNANNSNSNNNKEKKIKTRELSASSHLKAYNKTNKNIARPLVNNNIISTSNKSLPKAFNNIHINYKINNRNKGNVAKGLEPQNTKIIKPQFPKKIISKERHQSKIKININNVDQNDHHITNNKQTSVEKAIKPQLQRAMNQNGEISEINTNINQLQNSKHMNTTSKPQKNSTKEIEEIICSLASVSHHKSRNIQGDNNTFIKSKTINQSENDNNFLTETTLNNNMLTQMKTVNIENSKNHQNNMLQTTTKLMNQSHLNKKKIISNANVDTKKIKNYLNIKLNLNPKGTSETLANQIRKTFGMKIMASSSTKPIKAPMKSSSTSKPLKNSKLQNKTKTICCETNIDPSSPSKGSTNIPGSSSSTTTHKLSASTVPKSSSITNSKTNLAQNEMNDTMKSGCHRKTQIGLK